MGFHTGFGEKMLVRTEGGWQPLSQFLATINVPEGEKLKACKNLIRDNLMSYSKSEVEACIVAEIKEHFQLKTEEIRNLKQFYKEETAKTGTVKIPFNDIGDIIRTENTIFTMRDTKEIYIYKNGVYKNDGSETYLDRAIREECKRWGQVAKRDFVAEVMAYIRAFTYVDREQVDQSKYINFKNGLYNLDTGDFEEHTPTYCSIRQIPVNFDPGAKCPQIEKFLSEVVAPENIPLLYEWVGLSLIPCTEFGKAMMFYGKGSNGKSVFLNLLVRLLGKENISKESLQKLESDKFSVANLYGKLMNICPDLPSTTLHETDTFKQLTGNDFYIRGEEKYKSAFSFKNTARLTFSANELPKGKIDYAFSRRWLLIQFPNSFEGKGDKNLIEKLTPELSGFLNLALEGLKRLIENGKFSNSKSVEATQREYEINSNPVKAFLDQCTNPSEENVTHNEMYEEYKLWAEIKGSTPIGYNPFCKQMKYNGVETHRYNGFNEKIGHCCKMSEFVGIALDRDSDKDIDRDSKVATDSE